MSGLTCEETPLAWPSSVAIDDLRSCTTCGIYVLAPQAGPLQILTRRQGGGVGDGVNIEEANSVGADYRGQRYTYVESIFHTPGLHVFPGQKDVYPAEYHIHFQTYAQPLRALTLVIPVSHRAKDNPNPAGIEYFSAAAAQPDPNATRPTLSTILPPGAQIVQYSGPDIRGRTADVPTNDDCATPQERQFLLMQSVIGVRASDLERIPREGSLSTDPRDLPAPGPKPAVKQISRERLVASAMLAVPGILGAEPNTSQGGLVSDAAPTELSCKPLKVVDGRDVVDVSGQWTDITSLLSSPGGGGLLGSDRVGAATPVTVGGKKVRTPEEQFVRYLRYGAGAILGIFIANSVANLIWGLAFERTVAFGRANILKYAFYVVLFFTILAGSDAIDQIIAGFSQEGLAFYTKVWGCIIPPA
jgi:hypothetical protein